MVINLQAVFAGLLTLLIFYVYFLQNVIVTSVFGAALICLSLLLIASQKFVIPKSIAITISVVAILMLPGLLKIDHGLSKIFYFVLELSLIYFAWMCSKNKAFLLSVMKLLVWSFIIIAFTTLIIYFDQKEPFSHLIEGSSQNGIPSYLILITISYAACTIVVKQTVPIFAILACCVICFFGEGRGSILVSLLILGVAVFYLFFKAENTLKKKFVIYILFASAISGIIYSYSELYELVVTGSKLSVGLSDSHRLNILNDYTNKISENWSKIFLGTDYSATIIESKYNNNPHISFIRQHSFFGLISLIAVFSPLLFLMVRVDVKACTLFMLACAAVLRAATEPVLFPGLLDYYYFLMFFTYFAHQKRSSYRNNINEDLLKLRYG